jgi:hypothetical protein
VLDINTKVFSWSFSKKGLIVIRKQCCGSVTFWIRIRTYLWLTDPDSDPDLDPDPAPDHAIFVSDLQDCKHSKSRREAMIAYLPFLSLMARNCEWSSRGSLEVRPWWLTYLFCLRWPKIVNNSTEEV